MQVLKKEILKRIDEKPVLQALIAEAAGVSNQTVYLWTLKPEHTVKFLTLPILNAIKEYVKVDSIEELLEEAA